MIVELFSKAAANGRAVWSVWLLAAAVLAGCRQPWYAASETTSDGIAEAGDRLPPERAGSRTSGATPEGTDDTAGGDPFDRLATKPSGEEAMAELLEELDQAEGIDPATREELIADLQAADPASWPLIVQHMKATLAYRRQARGAEAGPAPTDSPDRTTHDASVRRTANTPSAVTSDEAARDSRESADSVQPAPADASDIATAFVADDRNPPANRSDRNADLAATRKVRTPLPEPGPAETPLRTAAQPAVAELSPAPQAPAPDEPSADASEGDGKVVRAAFEEPIYQTSESATIAAVASEAGPIDRTPPTDLPWDELLDLAIARLEAETSAAPATSEEIAHHARLRLLQLAAENDAAALAPIAGIPPSQQDFWAKQLFGLSTYLDNETQPDDRQRAALAQRHLQEATDQLGEVAVLDVRNLAFCKSIGGFGIYEPLQQPRLAAGEQVKLYAEVGNYRSEPTEDGYRTLLATSYEVLDESDRRVDSGEFPQVEDVCRSRRRDFHIQYGVNLPTRIYPGTYRLQLTIEDKLSRKFGRASVEFEIVDDRARAQ